jgi:hypothetical protein
MNEKKDVLTPFLDILNTNGDVWTEAGNYYPLIVSNILRDHKYEFGFSRKDDQGKELHNQWLFRTFVDNQTNTPASQEELQLLLKSLGSNTCLLESSNTYVKSLTDAIRSGVFNNFTFKTTTYSPTIMDAFSIKEYKKLFPDDKNYKLCDNTEFEIIYFYDNNPAKHPL